MTDEFEFTLHSPLTKEDWNKISDAELENTMSVTFKTPQGRQVRYIKCEALDKIRAEIEPKCDRINSLASILPYTAHREVQELLCEIMDLCKAESEEQ